MSRRRFRRCTLTAWAAPRLLSPCVLVLAGCTVPIGGAGLPAASARVAFQSPCAQNVIECTSSWPTAVASVELIEGQIVTQTETGFLIISPRIASGVPVQFIGSDSTRGDGATTLNFSWTVNATEDDPCVLTPGEEFSAQADPVVHLQPGFHYVRLTVQNDIIRDVVESEACGVFGTDIPSFDFVELEIEIRN